MHADCEPENLHIPSYIGLLSDCDNDHKSIIKVFNSAVVWPRGKSSSPKSKLYYKNLRVNNDLFFTQSPGFQVCLAITNIGYIATHSLGS